MAAAAHLNCDSTRFEIPSRLSSHHARELRLGVRRALEHGERRLVVDCGAWEEFDFMMLSSLIQCAAACREHGATFEVTSLSSDLKADVRELRLHDRLDIRE